MKYTFGTVIGDIKQNLSGNFVKKQAVEEIGADENNFRKLTPVQDADLSIYKNALDFVFANNDIKNIGISGAYCAGKTSIIASYKETCPETSFLHISLAYFESVDSEETKQLGYANDEITGNTNVISENILEGKILNQLIHQINPSNIPQSNFKMKNQTSKKRSFGIALSILLFCSAFLFTLRFESWKYYIESLSTEWLKNWLNWSTNNICLIVSSLIMASLITLLIYKIIQLQKNKNFFKKVKFQGNEIEIFEQSDDSYFDKYLNEVLYLFENANADVIVFEDMDRYNANQIFQRLREINTLINNRRQKEKQDPLRFFYLLRDDIFISKDRTKFFDFIIPIVPILDGSNSYDQFIEHFRAGGLIELFDDNFLQSISLYVDDMRILKNIYNEFIIYKNRISTTEQNSNKLLALLVYKNLFPRDFSNLQLNRGFVYNLFQKKDEFVNESKSSLETKIEETKNVINNIENEVLKSQSEINAVYSSAPNIDYTRQIKPELVAERDARILAIRQKADGSVENLNSSLLMCEKELQSLKNKKLCVIINKENIDSIFRTEYTNEIGQINKYHEIRVSEYFDLLKYLIRNGFIDETYPDYMTYFYENSISRNDKMFLRSVTDENAREYTYPLNQPEKVVRYLRFVDFEKEETLNFDLLSYLLTVRYQISTRSINAEQLKLLVLQLKNKKKYDFIAQYFYQGKEVRSFINYITRLWSQFFQGINEENNFTENQKKEFAIACIYFTNKTDLLEMNSDKVLSEFISNCSSFLQIDDPKTKKIIEVFKLLEIKFVFIKYNISNYKLWSAVYTHNLYEINMANIESILENQYKYSKSDNFKNKNFTMILSKPDEPLISYVQDNLEQYIMVLLEHCEAQITDNEEAIAYLLNNETISDEHKIEYVEYLQTTIVTLISISETKWWEKIIKERLLSYTEDNVLNYFFGRDNCFDSILIDHINEYGDEFCFEYDAINRNFGENNGLVFFNAVVQCNELQNQKYEAILSSLNRKLEIFDVKDLDEEKLKILIDHKILCMTEEILQFIREYYSEIVYYFIAVNIQDYIELTSDNGNIHQDEVLEVLKSDVEDIDKIQLLKLTNQPITVINKNYPAKIEEHILNYNYEASDLPILLKQYDSLSDLTKMARMKFFECRIDEIISNEYPLSSVLLLSFFFSEIFDISKKLELFIIYWEILTRRQCKRSFEIMQCSDYLSLFDGKRPTFEINTVNKKILDIFKEKGWITKFEEDLVKGYYRAYGRKQSMTNSVCDELL